MKTLINIINIPNALSILRLISPIPIIVTLLRNDLLLSCCIFIFAVLSDFLDGYIARHFNQGSKIGAMLDPLADKVLMTAIYLYFTMTGYVYWAVSAIVIFRDIMILLGIFLLYTKKIKIVFAPIVESKINTAIQLLFIVFVYCALFFAKLSLYIPYASFIVSASTLYTGFLYYKLLLKLIRNV